LPGRRGIGNLCTVLLAELLILALAGASHYLVVGTTSLCQRVMKWGQQPAALNLICLVLVELRRHQPECEWENDVRTCTTPVSLGIDQPGGMSRWERVRSHPLPRRDRTTVNLSRLVASGQSIGMARHADPFVERGLSWRGFKPRRAARGTQFLERLQELCRGRLSNANTYTVDALPWYRAKSAQ